MKFNKSILAAAALSAALFTSCEDEFRDTNTPKDAIANPTISYLFAQSVNKFEPSGYLLWYYNAPMTYSWSQMGVPTGGMTTGILTTTNIGDQGSKFIDVLRLVRDIEKNINLLPAEDQALELAYLHAAKVLTIYLGIFDSDMFGNLTYNEACRAGEGILTPNYDSMESLYAQWLDELDEAIAVFTNSNSAMTSTQDVVCGGKLDKWAKFANSLKLRLAVRYMANDMNKAKSIAAAVKSASCGYIDSLEDAILFNKGTNFSNGGTGNDWTYHWSNGFLDGTAATEHVMNFMVDNLDPRVRFCYSKNSWNSKIVQAYYDRGQEIPAFIEEDVEYTVDASGKKTFVAWKGAGEPWVRYKGFPMEYNSMTMSKYDWYYRPGNFKIAKADGTGEKSYQTFSQFQQMMVIGRAYNPSVPTTPEDVVSIASKDRPWYGLYLGGAEVNLYLAEFAMINGDESAAETYYNKALALSVQEYDKLAGLNQIEYYGTTYGYDPNEKVIDLVDGEIEAMMESEAYKFTGTRDEKLEKIYLQQLLNFTMYPNEQFITARRSGYPKIGSSLLPRVEYADIPVTTVPRRFDTGLPVETDLMYQIYMDNIKAQGFTATSNGAGHSDVLHNERIWADKNAPEWGAGHNW